MVETTKSKSLPGQCAHMWKMLPGKITAFIIFKEQQLKLCMEKGRKAPWQHNLKKVNIYHIYTHNREMYAYFYDSVKKGKMVFIKLKPTHIYDFEFQYLFMQKAGKNVINGINRITIK